MISSILLAEEESIKINGKNKLTVELNGVALINHAIKNILGSAINELIVILGYENKIIENLIEKNIKIKLVYNKDFKSGTSSSIKIGLNHISSKAKAFFICHGDMPKVNQSIYNKLIKARYNYNKKLEPENKKEIFVPTYEGLEGNPVLFSKFMKENIMDIKSDFEEKKIIELNKKKVLNVPLKNKGITLSYDTQEDFDFN